MRIQVRVRARSRAMLTCFYYITNNVDIRTFRVLIRVGAVLGCPCGLGHVWTYGQVRCLWGV